MSLMVLDLGRNLNTNFLQGTIPKLLSPTLGHLYVHKSNKYYVYEQIIMLC